jgi:hypothetical protein
VRPNVVRIDSARTGQLGFRLTGRKMIKIDSDRHIYAARRLADLDPNTPNTDRASSLCRAVIIESITGRGRRFMPTHIKPLRVTEYHFEAKGTQRSQQALTILLGGIAADFFGLKGYL